MLNLTLAGLSEDNKRLLLISDSGQEFTLSIDGRLRAAIRGEHARLGQLEIHMESTLRPRDIQARIRAGESAESVAQAASTTVDRIMAFADPVLAERAHVAQRAQRSSVRRKSGDQGARTLGDAVAVQLSPHKVAAETVEWDSWRREDGRWSLTAEYSAGERSGTAKFTFDQPGNYVTMDNDDARWLVGEAAGSTSAAGTDPDQGPARDDLKRARKRRLSAVQEDARPLGDDAIEIANDRAEEVADPDAETADLTETAERVRDEPAEPGLSPTPEPLAEAPVAAEPVKEEPAEEELPTPAQPKRTAKKKGRASVPSWDEIMFGGGKQD
ncbi:MAG: DUF3071 domain-containing protein [Nocardioides sp.]|nr:DUF3071 domain-containing protein [Nocardioides sp.]